MIKDFIDIYLFDRIPQNAKIGIYGLNDIAQSIYRDIKQKRPNIEKICLIDNYEREDFEGLKVYSLNDCVENNICDYVIVTTIGNSFVENILDVYNIQFITVNNYVIDYYLDKHKILDDNSYNEVIKIYKDEEDKKLFDLIFRRRKRIDDDRFLTKHYYDNYAKNITVNRTIKCQYLEKIVNEKVEILFDIGFNSGFNAIAYNKLLGNLKKIYAFEAIYDECKNPFIEKFIQNDKLCIIKSAVGIKRENIKFYINLNNVNASMMDLSNSFADKNITPETHKIIEAETITIDDYCKENNIKPDLIKMDIEGAELLALKGGIKTIKKHRPQLAISIYHCDSDFISIPKYLNENLENYCFKLGHYSPDINETILYALPNEIL